MTSPGVYDTEDFLRATNKAIDKLSRRPIASRAVKGTIDPLWMAGLPAVKIDGEDFVRSPGFPWDPGVAGTWVPAPGQRVWLTPENPEGYVITGPIIESRGFMITLPLAPYAGAKVTNYDTNWKEPSYTSSATYITMLTGMGKATAAIAAGETLWTIPVDFRPNWATTERVRFPINVSDTAAAVDIYGDGRVVAATAIALNQYIAIHNINFPNTRSSATWTPVGAPGAGAATEYANGWVRSADLTFSEPAYWVDDYGYMFWKGLLTNPAASPTTNLAMVLMNDTTLRPGKQLLFLAVGNNGGFGMIGADNGTNSGVDPALNFKTGTNWSAGGLLSLGGVYMPTPVADAQDWHTAPLVGWTNLGAIYAQWGLFRRSDGPVTARGLITGGVAGGGFAAVGPGAASNPYGAESLRVKGYGGATTSTTIGILQNRPSTNARGRLDNIVNGNLVVQTGTSGWFSMDGYWWVPEW